MNGHRDNPTPRWRTVFDLGSTALMIGIAVTLMWQGRERPTPVGATNTGAEASVPRDPVPIGDSAVRGSASASVAIIEGGHICFSQATYAEEPVMHVRKPYLTMFESCTAARETEAQVMAEKAEGAGLGVKATPTFFVGTVGPDRRVRVMQAFVGAKPIEELRTILDRVLAN